jgi:hypothetical protein
MLCSRDRTPGFDQLSGCSEIACFVSFRKAVVNLHQNRVGSSVRSSLTSSASKAMAERNSSFSHQIAEPWVAHVTKKVFSTLSI